MKFTSSSDFPIPLQRSLLFALSLYYPAMLAAVQI
jgi:hypothetical protein